MDHHFPAQQSLEDLYEPLLLIVAGRVIKRDQSGRSNLVLFNHSSQLPDGLFGLPFDLFCNINSTMLYPQIRGLQSLFFYDFPHESLLNYAVVLDVEQEINYQVRGLLKQVIFFCLRKVLEKLPDILFEGPLDYQYVNIAQVVLDPPEELELLENFSNIESPGLLQFVLVDDQYYSERLNLSFKVVEELLLVIIGLPLLVVVIEPGSTNILFCIISQGHIALRSFQWPIRMSPLSPLNSFAGRFLKKYNGAIILRAKMPIAIQILLGMAINVGGRVCLSTIGQSIE